MDDYSDILGSSITLQKSEEPDKTVVPPEPDVLLERGTCLCKPTRFDRPGYVHVDDIQKVVDYLSEKYSCCDDPMGFEKGYSPNDRLVIVRDMLIALKKKHA